MVVKKEKVYRSYKGRKPALPEMEEELTAWMKEALEGQTRLTQDQIRQKACQLAQQHCRDTKFAASKGWLEKFLRRNPLLAWMFEKHREAQRGVDVREMRTRSGRETKLEELP